MVVASLATKAEPLTLTASEMESVTAAAPVQVNVPVSVVTGGFRVQANFTTQVANAVSIAVATCGVCIGSAPSAFSFAAAANTNASRLIQR
jgi:hypothetical protein